LRWASSNYSPAAPRVPYAKCKSRRERWLQAIIRHASIQRVQSQKYADWQQLAEVDRFRRDLVANAAHELRTPITVMRASAENLVDGIDQPTPERLRMLLVQTERLGRLVNQLMDLSRLESGVVPFERQPVVLAELLDDAAQAIAIRGVAIHVVVEADRTTAALGDEERLRQVVTNLSDNALRHAPAGSTITLRAHTIGTEAILEVEDHGPGIAAEEASRVFDRFYRLDAARSADDGGAGLGLSIVKWVVELHKGSIEPVAAVPAGCRMIVRLPSADRTAP
jgi:signal transduction histidine kinase